MRNIHKPLNPLKPDTGHFPFPAVKKGCIGLILRLISFNYRHTQNKENPMPQNRLTVIFIIAFLNLVGFGIIIPILPYYASAYGLDAAMIGVLIAVYPAAQLVAGPVLGRLSDRYGRRPVLIATVWINTAAFVLFALAPNAWALFLSRIISGLAMGNSSVLEAYISDISEGAERTSYLGRVGAALGLGFIIGPALGGAFSGSGYAVPAFIAAGLSVINVWAIWRWLPESKSERPARQRYALWSLQQLRNALQTPMMGRLLFTRFVFSLAFSTFTTIFALFAQQVLRLNSVQTGYMLAYAGFLMILVQGILVERLVKRHNEGHLIFYSMLLMVAALCGWAFSDNVWKVVLVMIPLSVAAGIFRTVITSSLTRVSQPDEVGGVLGLSLSADSLTRVIAPSMGGFLMVSLGAAWPALSGALFLLLLLPGAFRHFVKTDNPVFRTQKETS